MRLVFFDESKNDNCYPSYHIGGIVIEDDRLLEVEAHVRAIAEDIFGNSRLTRETEFHAAEIFHRKKNFKSFDNFDARVDVLRRLIDILNLEYVHLIDIKINCDLLSTSQCPEDIAFMFLCERANDYMRSRQALGMLIGDRENDRSAARHAGSLSDYKIRGTDFAFGREITHLVDSVHFTQSHLSRFLQLADVYVWILQFQARNRGSENPRHRAVLELLRREGINLYPSKYKEWPVRRASVF
ncbi:MAG: DUF3800 domain-containing protein [Bacteroidia bacterium]|nr:DUF3800 domain-containing protein [Bacteroidia bacterium]